MLHCEHFLRIFAALLRHLADLLRERINLRAQNGIFRARRLRHFKQLDLGDLLDRPVALGQDGESLETGLIFRTSYFGTSRNFVTKIYSFGTMVNRR